MPNNPAPQKNHSPQEATKGALEAQLQLRGPLSQKQTKVVKVAKGAGDFAKKIK